MTRITKVDQKIMQQHLRESLKLALKGSIKKGETIKLSLTNESKILKMLADKEAENKRLLNVIDIKQREIDELNSKEMNLLWDLSKLQKDNGALQEYKDNNEKEIGYWEKKIMAHVKKKKDH